MKLTFYTLALTLISLTACVSKATYSNLQNDYKRVKNDSTLLEKRIRQLNDENVRLATESARMEQAMNDRLQEKQDSLNYKEQLIRDRELSLKDMKARKEEEQEAFMMLSRQILGDFSDYDKQTLVTTTGCTQITVALSDKKLFAPASLRQEYLATEINLKALSILTKYPDVNLTIISYADSIPVPGKDKNSDTQQFAYAKAAALYKELLMNQAKGLKTRVAIGVRGEHVPKVYPGQVDYVFYSSLLPCIHSK